METGDFLGSLESNHPGSTQEVTQEVPRIYNKVLYRKSYINTPYLIIHTFLESQQTYSFLLVSETH